MEESKKAVLPILLASPGVFVALVTSFALAGTYFAVAAGVAAVCLSHLVACWLSRPQKRSMQLLDSQEQPLSRIRVRRVPWMWVSAAGATLGLVVMILALRAPDPSSAMGIGRAVVPYKPNPGELWSVANGYQVAGDFNGDGECEWSGVAECGAGLVSWHGYCVPIDDATLFSIQRDVLERKDFSHVQRTAIVRFIEKMSKRQELGDNELLGLILNGSLRVDDLSVSHVLARGVGVRSSPGFMTWRHEGTAHHRALTTQRGNR